MEAGNCDLVGRGESSTVQGSHSIIDMLGKTCKNLMNYWSFSKSSELGCTDSNREKDKAICIRSPSIVESMMKYHELPKIKGYVHLKLVNYMMVYEFVYDDGKTDNVLIASASTSTASGLQKERERLKNIVTYSFMRVYKNEGDDNTNSRRVRIGEMKFNNSYFDDLYTDSVIYEFVPVGSKVEVAEILVKKPKNESRITECSCVMVLPCPLHGKLGYGSLVMDYMYGRLSRCEGWDLGCKIDVFITNKYVTTDKQLIMTRHGGANEMFSLMALEKDKFLVEFDSSMSPLQAFALCVSCILTRFKLRFVSNHLIMI